MKVFVYFNLRRKLFSVRSVDTGLVIAHVTDIKLRDVKFKVSEAGRQRVLKSGVKNVHAGVQGIVDCDVQFSAYDRLVRYNPFKFATFVDGRGRAVYQARVVHMYMVVESPRIRARV